MTKKVIKRDPNNINIFFQKTVDRLVKKQEGVNLWGKEMKLMKILWEQYPDKRIWANVTFQVFTLAWFLNEKGKAFLEKQKLMIAYELPEEKPPVVLSKEKVGEDVPIHRALSIKEFLNKYNK